MLLTNLACPAGLGPPPSALVRPALAQAHLARPVTSRRSTLPKSSVVSL
jgi:hypothetical protein